jgi:death on curing protein
MQYLTREDILLAHSMVIAETGGSHGVRDPHTILALEELPRQSAFGRELYPTLFDKAALYIRNIITAHPFIDGNKRTAMTASGIFLELNGHKLEAPEGEVEQFALRVISEKLTLEDIALWLKQNSTKVRPLHNRKKKKRS